MSLFHSRNNMQVFYAQTLTIAYIQRVIFNGFRDHVDSLDDSPEKLVLYRILSLYGSNTLLKHIGLLYEVRRCNRNTINTNKIFEYFS